MSGHLSVLTNGATAVAAAIVIRPPTLPIITQRFLRLATMETGDEHL
ncbi:hypothetical protein SM11_pD0381 (plasmid) [Sinorhizobium meliloti SM11]|uniref:Uncharacterized protein n=1 Tax=Sinorhizobium meliloti (strain SM11) TaxID=707241 RepID=F7XJN6_SINMM|nr:hypothetical protein SM11_pD0381 [Sinorhizobium meliloti SM11]